MTDNHNYNTPAKGSTDWHIPLNENFEFIDTDVEIRDTDANKGNYTPKNNAKFVATDTNKVYFGDGTDWNHVGTYRTDDEVASQSEFDSHTGDLTAHIGGSNSPSQGTFSFDGTDLLAGTGGTTRNLTNIGTGSGSGTITSHQADVILEYDDQWPEVGLVNRPLAWGAQGDRGSGNTIYVGPNGSQNAAGTQADPYSLDGLLDHLPNILGNLTIVDLYTVPNSNGNTPVTYTADAGSFRCPNILGQNNHAELRFVGNASTPSDVQIDSPWNAGFFGKGDHLWCQGIQFNSSVQHNGFGKYTDCNLHNTSGALSNQCFTTKQGKILIKTSSLGTGTQNEVLRGHHTSHFSITGCDFNSGDGSPFAFDEGSVACLGQNVTFSSLGGTSFTNATNAEAAGLINDGAEGARLIGHDKIVVSAAGTTQVYNPDYSG